MTVKTKYRVQITLTGEKCAPLKRDCQKVLTEFTNIASQHAEVLSTAVGTIDRTMIATVTFRSDTLETVNTVCDTALETLTPQWNHDYDVCALFSPVTNSLVSSH